MPSCVAAFDPPAGAFDPPAGAPPVYQIIDGMALTDG